MTQYKAIPQATDQRNQSQVDILNNFNYLNSQSVAPNNGIILVDHLATGDNGLSTSDGFHKQVSLLNRATPANLTNAVNAQNSNGIAYTKNDTAPSALNPQLHFYNGVNDFQLTPCLPLRAWASFTVAAGVVTVLASFNVVNIAYNGVGIYTINLTNAIPSANYFISITGCPPNPGVLVGSIRGAVYPTNGIQINYAQIGVGGGTEASHGSFVIYGG